MIENNSTFSKERRDGEGKSLLLMMGNYGIIAGVIICVFFLLMHALLEFDEISVALTVRYIKFAILAIVIYAGIKNLKYHNPKKFSFFNGMILGTGISAVAASVILVAELITMVINPDIYFEPFYYPVEGRIVGILLSIFETTIIGAIVISLGISALLQKRVTKEVNTEAERQH